jgi:hypothetical protein
MVFVIFFADSEIEKQGDGVHIPNFAGTENILPSPILFIFDSEEFSVALEDSSFLPFLCVVRESIRKVYCYLFASW